MKETATRHTRRRGASGWVRSAGQALLGLVYPPRCIGCGARLADERLPLCHRCIQGFERPTGQQLAALLEPLSEAQAALDALFALWLFDAAGAVQRVQHQVKYGNRPRYGVALGRLIGTAYRDAGLPVPDVVLPVPLHRARRYERGYNQSAMLAAGVGQALGVPAPPDLLARRRATRSQTHLSRQRRWDNVSGAFAVAEAADVAGRRLLLVDDVLTTGATLTAAAVALRQAGATAVYAAALALARR